MDKPRDWCDPPEAFGKLKDVKRRHIYKREWCPPSQPEATADPRGHNQWASFRAAIIQNFYSLHLRTHKNDTKVTRDALGAADQRPEATTKWTARLNGTAWWNLDDTAVILQHYPQGLPPWEEVRHFIDVVTGVIPMPYGWNWPDSPGPPRSI